MSRYRIGEFANILGVTPDFLKYYEKEQLLIPEKDSKSGYRYYHFYQTAMLMQHIRDRNLGFSVKESRKVANDISFEDYMATLHSKKQSLVQSIAYKKLLLQYISRMEQLERWMQQPGTWYIEETPSLWLLPHSNDGLFLENQELVKAASQWYLQAPVTKSCCFYPADCLSVSGQKSSSFYLAATEEAVETLKLPLPPQAKKTPGARCLVIPVHETITCSDRPLKTEYYLTPVKQILDKYHFQVTGDFCRIMYAVFDRTDKRRESWHVFYVPIAV